MSLMNRHLYDIWFHILCLKIMLFLYEINLTCSTLRSNSADGIGMYSWKAEVKRPGSSTKKYKPFSK